MALIVFGLVIAPVYALCAQALAGTHHGLALALMRAHGVVAVFLCVVPALPMTLGGLVLPRLIGARGVALPTLGRLALWLHALAFALSLVALATGATNSTWHLALAFSATQASGVVLWLVASAVAMSLAVAANGVNTIVTVHQLRDRSLERRSLSPIVWGLYAAGIVNVITAPVAVVLALLVLGERTVGIGVFDPALGGDPLLFLHSVWLYLHPALMGALAASLGVVAHLLAPPRELDPRPRYDVALPALAVLGLLGWGQHLLPTMVSGVSALEVSLASLSVQVPLLWFISRQLIALRRGGARLSVARGYGLAFVAHLAVFAPTSVALSLPETRLALDATTFVSGNLHYLSAGGVVFALLGGLHHFWPELTGRTFDARRAAIALALLAIGTNLTSLTMLVQGGRGAPRPALMFSHGADAAHVAVSIGGVMILGGLILAVSTLVESVRAPSSVHVEA